jgi:hypothetical protein
MSITIAFGDGRLGNNIFQYVALAEKYEKFFLVIEGTSAIKIKRDDRCMLIVLHPRLFRIFKKTALYLAGLLRTSILSEAESTTTGPQGVWKQISGTEVVVVVHSFYMVYARCSKFFYKAFALLGTEISKCDETLPVYDGFLHIRLGDYRAFIAQNKKLDFVLYERYYEEALKIAANDFVPNMSLCIISDEPHDPMVKRVSEIAEKYGFLVFAVPGEPSLDWRTMANAKSFGICSASTFSLSAGLAANNITLYMPNKWLNFTPGQTYPSSMDLSGAKSSPQHPKVWKFG